MELEEEIVRIQACEKCHEHDKIDPHSELHYHNAFQSCKKAFNEHGFKVVKNIPYKYLVKAPDTKASTKRYFDQNTHKVQQFPRKGSFEIYYMNILLFSKLQQAQFPAPAFLLEIIKRIKKYYKVNPLLEAFQSFRDIQIDRKKSQKVLSSFNEYIKLFCPKDATKAQLDKFFIKFEKQKNLEKEKKKIIYPYSFYAMKEKQCKMEKIYCPTLLKKSIKENKSYKNITIKSSYKTRPPTSPGARNFVNKTQLFNMVRLGGQKSIDSKKIQSFQKQDLTNAKINKSKNLYISYLNQAKRGKSEIKQVNSKTGRLPSAKMKQKNSQSTERLVQLPQTQMKKISSRSSNNNTQRLFNKQTDRNSESQNNKNSVKKNSSDLSSRPLNSGCLRSSKKSQLQKKKEIYSIINEEMKNIIDNIEWGSQNKKGSSKQKQKIGDEEKQITKEQQEVEELKCFSENKKKQDVDQLWQTHKFEANIQYEPANITRKFSQEENFSIQVFQNVYQLQESQISNFNIQGSQLNNNFNSQSIRKYYKPGQLKLFPITFHTIEGKSKLVCAVNLLLQQNPILISRLFENKKFINPYGIYCIWLKGQSGSFQPIIINDKFAFSKIDNELMYSKPANQNCIWFMLLQKAFAKLLGGYYRIQQTPFSEILSMILNCPKVQFKNLCPEKMLRILNQKIFYNRLAYLYSIFIDKFEEDNDTKKKVKRITNFKKVANGARESQITLQRGQEKETLMVKQFLMSYNFISLIFFNSNFNFNQSKLPNTEDSRLITCELKSRNSKNDCYLVFTNFPGERFTKVSIFKKLTNEQANITAGMNPLEEEQKKYEYVGEIEKKQNFFFETQLDIGEYVCLFEGKFQNQDKMHLSIYSQKQIYIHEIKVHQTTIANNNKKQSDSFYLKEKKVLSREKRKDRKQEAPKVLMEKSLFKNESPSKFKKQKKNTDDFKIRKKFIVSDESSEMLSGKEN